MYKLINIYVSIFILILFSITSSNTHATTNCEYIEKGTSKTLGSDFYHCVTIPIYTNKPLIIVQYEEPGISYNKFIVDVKNSTHNNAENKESFTSDGSVTIHRSFKAANMGEVVLKIRPVSTNRKSKAKIMYGDIDGIYTVFIHNTTDLNPPPTDDGE